MKNLLTILLCSLFMLTSAMFAAHAVKADQQRVEQTTTLHADAIVNYPEAMDISLHSIDHASVPQAVNCTVMDAVNALKPPVYRCADSYIKKGLTAKQERKLQGSIHLHIPYQYRLRC